MLHSWLLLGLAIVAEVIGTSALKASDGFTRAWPVGIVIVGYGLAFYLMSVTLRVLPMSVVYAVWSGVGIVLITAVGWLVFGQRLNLPTLAGVALIVAGVIVLNLYPHTLPPHA